MEVPTTVYDRYCDLQQYVGWTPADITRLQAAAPLVAPRFESLVNDFYAELQRHPPANAVITGGAAQIDRLKQSLANWLRELFSGPYDQTYIARRWRVGLRHVEIGLPQTYAAAALSRLRNGIVCALGEAWDKRPTDLVTTLESLNRLLDLDFALMSDAYETDYVRRQREVERQRVNDMLQREQELSSVLLANAQVAIVILDREGKIVRCNPYLESLAAGRWEGAIENCDWCDLFLAPPERAALRTALLSPLADARENQVRFTSSFDQAGRNRQVRWAAVPLRDSLGRPFAVLIIGHDITDLVEAQQKALQAERLAAIGEMATGLAHESRNALQKIGASAEMLELEVEGNAAALALVHRIDQAKTQLHQLLEDVRTYAAPIVLDRSSVRLSETWREAWGLLLARRQGRDVQLHEQIAGVNLATFADRFRLVQVFRNLFDNALAAATDPARIEVVCEPTTVGKAPAIRVAVRDNGPGLSLEQRRRIFEPFYTTKPTGTGLGTAIAQRLVEAHGGSIAVGNHAPGTEIVIVLPVSLT